MAPVNRTVEPTKSATEAAKCGAVLSSVPPLDPSPMATRRFRHGHYGDHGAMNKWRYALFGWVAWKVTRRYMRRKLP
jgi:hypothetical protein